MKLSLSGFIKMAKSWFLGLFLTKTKFSNYNETLEPLIDTLSMAFDLSISELDSLILKYREKILTKNKSVLADINSYISKNIKSVISYSSKSYIQSLKDYYSDDGLLTLIYFLFSKKVNEHISQSEKVRAGVDNNHIKKTSRIIE